MGGSNRKPLLPETLETKSRSLFLSKDAVLKAYKLFVKVSTSNCEEQIRIKRNVDLPEEKVPNDPDIWKGGSTNRMRLEQFLTMKCFRANVLSPRIFSLFQEGDGGMSFESFLVLVSSLSQKAPFEIKSLLAFSVFDFDNDGIITNEDLRMVLNIFSGNTDLWNEAKLHQISDERFDLTNVWSDNFPVRHSNQNNEPNIRNTKITVPETFPQRVFSAIDFDGSMELTDSDFEAILSRIPDFITKFTIDVL